MSKRVFIDSSAFFALLNRLAVVTTEAVVIESYALFLNRLDRRSAVAFLDRLAASSCLVEHSTQADYHQAIDLVRDHEDKTYSLCDALSFVVMERLGIAEAIAFDRDFRQRGITLL